MNDLRDDSLTFPPIPFASGSTIVTTDGSVVAVRTVAITITAEDGSVISIALEYRGGGWWATTQDQSR
ncbi:hypothetical protein BJ973_004000 [Actinoplanes tereljensis]|uniref:Uncharacterized protein n=1 Tax=Paractinoplanes tereljensis TaxID=571912 RepID=A0A919NWN8_9ACTN|nr:hypothetical protein [Actinoplanes tereljensis]GIF25723.1 hypothetical protein Ate02nite_84530 [Actinoplanes tereljensis]